MTTTPPTRLRYHDDPLLLTFDATVVAHGAWRGKPSVILDESAFYPEAGGQMADRGTLAGFAIEDVQVDDAGAVHHLLAAGGALPDVGARVRGEIERQRRRQHMALHTAQHMLSRALIETAQAETVSARLGETICTVDVDVPGLADSALAKAEALVNALVDDDVAVRAWFPSPEELRTLPLRRAPKVDEHIRVVAVGGASGDVKGAFDVSPCGGTHCLRTAQVGLVRVVGVERYKGMMRVSFHAGARARDDAFARARAIERIAREMSSAPDDVAGAIDKLRDKLKAAADERKALTGRLADALAASLVAQAAQSSEPGRIACSDIPGGADVVRAVAARCVELAPSASVLCAGAVDDGVHVVIARGAQSTFDCGAFLKQVAAAAGGKGGGKPDRAEGKLPANAKPW